MLRKLLFGIRVALVRLRFVGLMVAAALAVAYFDDIRLRVERALRPAKAPDLLAGEAAVEFYCPMHPNVVRAEMGNCPICGMPLSKRKKGEKEPLPGGVLARVQLSPYRIALAGVATATVERRSLEKTIETVGTIEIDERRVAEISARIAGRAEKLHVDFTGRKVAAGEPLYEVYSPDLLNTQREYLLALRAARSAGAATSGAVPPRSPTLDAARERLLLWGIRPEQIDELERRGTPSPTLTIHAPIAGTVVSKEIREGQYVNVGDVPYTVADLSVVWMVAKVYEDEAALVRLGERVEIRSVAFPGRTFEGRVSFIAPTLDQDTRTVAVRVDVPNALELLKPGMYVTAILRAPIGPDGRPGGAATEVVYRCCSACPEIEARKPGPCPKCGMPLMPVERAAAGGGAGDYLCKCPMHPDQVYRGDAPGACALCGAPLVREATGASTSTKKTVYWCPMHPEVTQDEPGICTKCGAMELVPKEVTVVEEGTGPLAVPAAAVIDTGGRTLVYKESSEGVFDAVEVTLGPRAGDFYPVVAGLSEGDRVVAQGSFLVDAEARLNPAAGSTYFGASAR